MPFFSPWNLLWLAPLLGGILALYFLRMQRRDQVVSSLYLWQSIIQENRADRPFQRLRASLLLILQLVTMLLLVFALARPFALGSVLGGESYALIIDVSASMNATDVAPSRLARARQAASDFVAQTLHGTDQAVIVTAGAQPHLSAPKTRDKARLTQDLQEIEPTDTVADLPAAATVARAALGRDAARAHFLIYSDGAWPDDAEPAIRQAAGNGLVQLIPIGTPQPTNVGIVVMDARDDPLGGLRGPQVFVNARNFGTRTATGTLHVTLNGAVIASRALTLAGDGSYGATFSAPGFSHGGTVTARLTDFAGDDLADDDTASLILPPTRPRRVLLVTRGNVFLEKAVSLDSSVELYEVTPEKYDEARRQSAFDVTIFDDSLPADLPPGRFLVFHAVNARMPITGATGDVNAPVILDWERTHPIMRFVDLTNVHVQAALAAQPAPWSEVLADGSQGPLIVTSDKDSRRIVWTSFVLSQTDFPLKVAFPVFVTNAISWLASGERDHPYSIASGTPLLLPYAPNGWTVTTPDGAKAQASCGTESCAFTDTTHVGLYRAANASQTLTVASNLTNAAESDITSVAHPSLESAPSAFETQTARLLARRDLWPWVAFAALVLLALEWLAYHRRL